MKGKVVEKASKSSTRGPESETRMKAAEPLGLRTALLTVPERELAAVVIAALRERYGESTEAFNDEDWAAQVRSVASHVSGSAHFFDLMLGYAVRRRAQLRELAVLRRANRARQRPAAQVISLDVWRKDGGQ